MMFLFTLVGIAGPVLGEPLPAIHWPAWRGPLHNGHAPGSDVPVSWSTNQSVAWKVPLPEPGNSTPVIWGDQIFLTQPEGTRRTIRSYALPTGELQWTQGIEFPDNEPTHNTNPYCSASPVTDGEVVVAWFGSAGVWCGTLDGKERWRRDLGPQTHEWGTAISPVLLGDLCFVQCGAGDQENLTAFNKWSGELVWQVNTPQGPADELGEVGPEGQSAADRDSSRNLRGAWGTPLVITQNNRSVLIVASPARVSAYDPPTGKLLWTCRGLGPLVYASPLQIEEHLLVLGGYHSGSVAVRLPSLLDSRQTSETTDITDTHRTWHAPRGPLWLGSPLAHANRIYIPDMQGILHVWDAKTFEPIQKKRFAASTATNACWSSPVFAGGHIYLPNQAGDVFVISPDDSLTLVATNSLHEPMNASLAIVGQRLLIRTHKHLWCIAND